jgi:hypothetical protein
LPYLPQDSKETKKPKLFDIVHVEVVAAVIRQDEVSTGGPPGVAGEVVRVESFGSRLGHRAARHSSYKATSKAWKISAYHFRDLSAWLEGVAPNPLSVDVYNEYAKHFKHDVEETKQAATAATAAAAAAAAAATKEEEVAASMQGGTANDGDSGSSDGEL